MNDKQTLRQQLLALRQQIEPSVKKLKDSAIAVKVLARPEVQNAKTVCIYESLPAEVDTRKIIQVLQAQGKIIIIPPPSADALKNKEYIDVFIVPGVAFERDGHRLGRGGGYYDRVLADIHVSAIGLAYESQIVSGLPKEKYDIPVTTVITEKETYGQKTS